MEGDQNASGKSKECGEISIHALRVEGDLCEACHNKMHPISIHALRVEGDISGGEFPILPAGISIHALRVEGDVRRRKTVEAVKISIHALRVEGDTGTYSYTLAPTDFYPRPPGGGRPKCIRKKQRMRGDFYPRPPGGGRLPYAV